MTAQLLSRFIFWKTEYSAAAGFAKEFLKIKQNITKFEIEEEITADVYEQLSHDIVLKSRPIRKTRHCFDFKGQLLELDIYEFWKDKATVEVELGSEQQTVILPDFIEVIADVTGNRNYSNYSLSFNNSIF